MRRTKIISLISMFGLLLSIMLIAPPSTPGTAQAAVQPAASVEPRVDGRGAAANAHMNWLRSEGYIEAPATFRSPTALTDGFGVTLTHWVCPNGGDVRAQEIVPDEAPYSCLDAPITTEAGMPNGGDPGNSSPPAGSVAKEIKFRIYPQMNTAPKEEHENRGVFVSSDEDCVMVVQRSERVWNFTTILENRNCPTTRDFKIKNLGTGYDLALNADGLPIIVGGVNGTDEIYAWPSPWAVDADGNILKTTFKLVGPGDNTVRQTVELKRGTTFPVAMDPSYYWDWWTLSLFTTFSYDETQQNFSDMSSAEGQVSFTAITLICLAVGIAATPITGALCEAAAAYYYGFLYLAFDTAAEAGGCAVVMWAVVPPYPNGFYTEFDNCYPGSGRANVQPT